MRRLRLPDMVPIGHEHSLAVKRQDRKMQRPAPKAIACLNKQPPDNVGESSSQCFHTASPEILGKHQAHPQTKSPAGAVHASQFVSHVRLAVRAIAIGPFKTANRPSDPQTLHRCRSGRCSFGAAMSCASARVRACISRPCGHRRRAPDKETPRWNGQAGQMILNRPRGDCGAKHQN
jgi:hypothetical protein